VPWLESKATSCLLLSNPKQQEIWRPCIFLRESAPWLEAVTLQAFANLINLRQLS